MRFILVHSLSVGPSTWEPVREVLSRRHDVELPDLLSVAKLDTPSGPRVAELLASATKVTEGEVLSVVSHSNAGLFAPAIGAALAPAAVRYIFVDASIPPSRGSTKIVPAEFMDDLRAKARSGLLPRWSDWWDAAEITPMLPVDIGLRDAVVREQPRLPVAFYEQSVDVPAGWDSRPCGYIYFGPSYDQPAPELRRRGWEVRHVPGLHLHMTIDPVAVSVAIEDVAAQLAGRAVSP